MMFWLGGSFGFSLCGILLLTRIPSATGCPGGTDSQTVPYGTDIVSPAFQALRTWLRSFSPCGTQNTPTTPEQPRHSQPALHQSPFTSHLAPITSPASRHSAA